METKDKLKAGIIFSLIILAVVGMFFGFGQLNIIDTGTGNIIEFTSAKCSVSSDCDSYFLSQGISIAELNEQKELATLECGNQGYCIAEVK